MEFQFPYSSIYMDMDPSFNKMLNNSMDDMSARNKYEKHSWEMFKYDHSLPRTLPLKAIKKKKKFIGLKVLTLICLM